MKRAFNLLILGSLLAAPALAQEALPVPDPPLAEAAVSSAEVVAGESVDMRGLHIPEIVRVGLASDLERLTLPCCDGGLRLLLPDGPVPLAAAMVIEPAAGAADPGTFRLQVAALRDPDQASAQARQLQQQLSQPADARFDPETGLFRVRVGGFAQRAEADAFKSELATLGYAEVWVATEGGGLTEPALRVRRGSEEWTVPGRWLRLDSGVQDAESAASRRGIRHQGKRYRGRLAVFLNNRGTLNLVNELTLDDYLRGVVPKEMGPILYPELEALKAQAIAARTYTLRHLGEFDAEGYDICATPRCQVYGGLEAEHPLSDRAISETSGEVLIWSGDAQYANAQYANAQYANAMYTATCGGHTEDVEIVFPNTRDPYLRGVACLEAGVQNLRTSLPAGTAFPHGLTRDLLPLPPGDTLAGTPESTVEARLETRLRQLARLAGLPLPDDHLASLERREVQRFVASLFDLALDARLFVSPQDVPYLLHDPPPDWGPDELRQAASLVQSGLLSGSLDAALSDDEVELLLYRLAEMLYVVRRDEVTFLALEARSDENHSSAEPAWRLRLHRDGSEETLDLSAAVPAYRRVRSDEDDDTGNAGPSASPTTAAELALVPGDHLHLYYRGDRLLALVQRLEPRGVAFDRRSKRSLWRRFRTDAQLAASVHKRYPGIGFQSFEIVERGPSGRVARLRLEGRRGQQQVEQEVEGLAVRWTLDLPETLFTATRLTPEGGQPGWLFRGRGWGHGVGLCQVGAYGMAVRGHGYRDILNHYYRGLELVRLPAASLAEAPLASEASTLVKAEVPVTD